MPLVAVLDFETEGLALDSKICEYGVVRFDSASGTIVDTESRVCYGEDYKISEEAFKAHGLNVGFLREYGVTELGALVSLRNALANVDYIGGHNLNNFDWPILQNAYKRNKIASPPPKPLIDTQTDLPFPSSTTSRRLIHLLADNGLHNPFPHRALFDAVMTYRLLRCFDFDTVVERSKSPMMRVIAEDLPREKNDVFKKRRYRWDANIRRWYKEMKEFDVEREIKEATFKIEKVEKTGNQIQS